jgi:hypothetical protein
MASVERRSTGPRQEVHYPLGERMCSGDLLFIDGQPVLVISWRTMEWKRVPYICFRLDADRLRPSATPGVYVYDGALTLAGKPLKRSQE